MRLIILALVLFSNASFMAFCQPPPTFPPSQIHTEGTIPEPINIGHEPSGTIRFNTINNTPCDIEVVTWFVIEKRSPNGEVISVHTGDLPYTLAGQTQGAITNYELFDIFNLPVLTEEEQNEGINYHIVKTGIYLKFGAMSGFMEIYPTDNGLVFYLPGLPAPCNCFSVHFTYTNNSATLTIAPCP